MRTLDETLTMIEEIEYSLSISTKGMPPALLTEILSDRLALLAMAPEIMEFASWYHSKGREEVFQEIMASPEIRKEKADNVKLFVNGRLAERDAFYGTFLLFYVSLVFISEVVEGGEDRIRCALAQAT